MIKINNKKIKVIGFDLDQTLYQKSKEIDGEIQKYIYIKIAENKKISISRATNLFKNLYKEGRGLSGSKSLKALNIPQAKEIIQEALERADISLYLKPNIQNINLLKRLKDRYKNIDLITGSNLKITKLKLKKLQIPQEIFSHLITQDNGSKSDETAYKIWLNLYPRITSKEFLYIGDRLVSDYLIPKKLKIKTILVNQEKAEAKTKCLQLLYFNDLEKYLL